MGIEELKSQEAKINFLKGLIRISKIDGKVDNSEWSFFLQAGNAMGLDGGDLAQLQSCWNTSEPIQVTFSEASEKAFFFIQAIQLCWIDNSYDESERKEIRKLAFELHFSEASIEKIEQWVQEGIEWNKKGDSLLKLR